MDQKKAAHEDGTEFSEGHRNTEQEKINQSDCPKFSKCSAPVCPLDANMVEATHLNGEPVCFYLSEYAKPDNEANLRDAIRGSLYEVIEGAFPVAIDTYGPLRRRLERASRTPSRLGVDKVRTARTNFIDV